MSGSIFEHCKIEFSAGIKTKETTCNVFVHKTVFTSSSLDLHLIDGSGPLIVIQENTISDGELNVASNVNGKLLITDNELANVRVYFYSVNGQWANISRNRIRGNYILFDYGVYDVTDNSFDGCTIHLLDTANNVSFSGNTN